MSTEMKRENRWLAGNMLLAHAPPYTPTTPTHSGKHFASDQRNSCNSKPKLRLGLRTRRGFLSSLLGFATSNIYKQIKFASEFHLSCFVFVCFCLLTAAKLLGGQNATQSNCICQSHKIRNIMNASGTNYKNQATNFK